MTDSPELPEAPVRIDTVARLAWQDGQSLHLTPLEFDLLAYLAARPGAAIRRGEIMREVWQIDFVTSTKTLDAHVASLRLKLGDDSSRYIITVRGVGFRLEPGMVDLAEEQTGPYASLTRVVLVKPGDVLVFGNVGRASERFTAAAGALRDQLRLGAVVLFPGDIDMAAIPGNAHG
jgi:DNA-binding winged helix-turn-helix (wHTH) protein